MADDSWVEAGSEDVWLGSTDDGGRPVPVQRSALEELLVCLDRVRPPTGAPEEHRSDWFRVRVTLLDLVRRGAVTADPDSSRLASGLVDEALSEAGLMFAPPGSAPHEGRYHRTESTARADWPPPSEPLWRNELEKLIRRYRRDYPGVTPRHVVPAPPARSTDPGRYRSYFRLTDPTTKAGPAATAPPADRAVWHAHRAEQLEAIAAQLFTEGSCGSELVRKAAAGARTAAHRAALGY